MDVAGRQVENLSRRERHPVEQQRDDDAGIPRVLRGERRHGRHLGVVAGDAEFRERGDERDEGRHPGAVADEPFEGVRQRDIRTGERLDQVVERLRLRVLHREGCDAQRLQQRPRLFERAEAAERIELGTQRVDELGLRKRVLVVAVRGVERHAEVVLAFEAEPGLFGGGMGLQRQGRGRREDLEQERQPTGCRIRAERGGRVRGDPLREVCGAAGLRRIEDHARRPGVRPEPQLRLGSHRGFVPEKLRDGRGRPPRVRPG